MSTFEELKPPSKMLQSGVLTKRGISMRKCDGSPKTATAFPENGWPCEASNCLPLVRRQKKCSRKWPTWNLLRSWSVSPRRTCLSRVGERLEILTFRAKHAYPIGPSGIQVPIGLRRHESRPVWLLAKADTGASFCIFERDYAAQMGIDVESGFHEVVVTPTGRLAGC